MTAASTPPTTGAEPADIDRLVALARQACDAYGRDDLLERVERVAAAFVADSDVHVVVVGDFKQGKSSLVNALVGAEVCPVDDDIATAVPTLVRYGPPGVEVVTRSTERADAEPERCSIEFADVGRYVTEVGADSSEAVDGVEIRLERELLRSGLVVIDTPGVGGLGSAHATAALGALSLADAVLFVTDASQELTRTEVDFLHRVVELCDTVVAVLTKVDFSPRWRTVTDLNRGHLAEAGFSIPCLPVSSSLRTEALRLGDRDLNVESGFPALVRVLLDDIVASRRRRAVATVRDELLAVCDQLRSQFEAVVATASDPNRARTVVERLEQARNHAEQLRSRTARWSITLNDGFADLSADIDHDFRERIRCVVSDADEAIAVADPAAVWGEFEPWLVERVSFEVVANYRYLSGRADALSALIAEHFAVDGEELRAALDVAAPSGVMAKFAEAPEIDTEGFSVMGQGFAALRGSYMGILMFSMLGSMVGLALGPVAVGAGLLMGRKSLRDEKERRLQQRRVEARNAVRRYCDEVSFQVGKDGRDVLRRVQRQLRDHYTKRADELHRSATEAVNAATSALHSDRDEAARQQRDAEAELARIRSLHEQIALLTGQHRDESAASTGAGGPS